MSNYFYQGTRFSQQDNRHRALIAVSIACLIAASGGGGLFLLLSHDPVPENIEPKPVSAEIQSVLVPRADIEPNKLLQPSMFVQIERPSQYLPLGSVKSFEEINGQYARGLLLAGQPFNLRSVSSVQPRSPLSPQLCKGCRAVTIRVNDLSSVNGLIAPGELVDVAHISSYKSSEALRIIVQGAKVVALDKRTQGEWKQDMPLPGTVTLQVGALDAQKIVLAQARGSLSLLLRPQIETSDPGYLPVVTQGHLSNEQDTPLALVKSCVNRIRLCERDGGGCAWHCISQDGMIEKYEAAG